LRELLLYRKATCGFGVFIGIFIIISLIKVTFVVFVFLLFLFTVLNKVRARLVWEPHQVVKSIVLTSKPPL
jgi:hypothetical protein